MVLEKDRLGTGSTGKNAGGIRLQFSTEVNVRLSQRALPRLEAFKDEMGVDPQCHQVGYLFLITEERDVAPFERSLALWHGHGVPATRLSASEAQALFPEVRVDDVRFATFCAKDGYADPHSILQGYVARARERGVEFRKGAEVTGIELERGRVAAVRAAGDRIVCGTVIDAAGAWGARIGSMVGLALPIAPLRRHIFVTAPVPGLDHEFPLTIEFSSGLYFHRESGGVLLGMADPIGADRLQIDLVAQPNGKGVDGPLRVVLRAIEPPVHGRPDTCPHRLEERDDGEGRDRDRDAAPGGERREDELEQRDAADLRRGEQRGDRGIDERPADEDVDVVEAIARDGNTDRDWEQPEPEHGRGLGEDPDGPWGTHGRDEPQPEGDGCGVREPLELLTLDTAAATEPDHERDRRDEHQHQDDVDRGRYEQHQIADRSVQRERIRDRSRQITGLPRREERLVCEREPHDANDDEGSEGPLQDGERAAGWAAIGEADQRGGHQAGRRDRAWVSEPQRELAPRQRCAYLEARVPVRVRQEPQLEERAGCAQEPTDRITRPPDDEERPDDRERQQRERGDDGDDE